LRSSNRSSPECIAQPLLCQMLVTQLCQNAKNAAVSVAAYITVPVAYIKKTRLYDSQNHVTHLTAAHAAKWSEKFFQVRCMPNKWMPMR
jgi:hypothetical protein